MVTLTIEEILRATQGKLLTGNSSLKIKGVSIDSRTTKKENLFFAIRGKRCDGHDFLEQAIKSGAVGVVVSKRVSCLKNRDLPVILVADTTKALGETAAHYRRKFSIPVIALTGSAGKTTTKEMIASILSNRYKVLKSEKSENNQFGLPLTLLKLDSTHEIVVVELGTNQPGDIAYLSKICSPTVSVFTNIGESHLERLKNALGVYKEKYQLIKSTSPEGCIIFNADDEYLRKIPGSQPTQKIRTFAVSSKAAFQAKDIRVTKDFFLEFNVGGTRYRVPSPARHNVYNALAAISCGDLFNVSSKEMKNTLAGLEFGNGRQELQRCGFLWLIDDTYNSNLVSIKSAIRTLETIPAAGRKIFVCADMLELGNHSRPLHEAAGRFLGRAKMDLVLTIGKDARYIQKSLKDSRGETKSYFCPSIYKLHHRLKEYCQPEDVVLVKGSRGMAMERTVKFLKENFK